MVSAYKHVPMRGLRLLRARLRAGRLKVFRDAVEAAGPAAAGSGASRRRRAEEFEIYISGDG